MKNITLKLCSLFLVIMLLLPLCVLMVNASEYVEEPGYNDTFYQTRNLADYVSATEYVEARYPGLKNHLRGNFINFNTSIDISQYAIHYNYTIWDALTDMIYSEMPDMLHIYTVSCSYNPESLIITSLTVQYSSTYTKQEYLQVLGDLENATNKILYGILGNNSLSDAEKALLVHDRLAIHCEYAMGEIYNYAYSHSMYGALALGAAVCQGYSEAYSYLLDRIGIKTATVISQQLNHAWNAVYIDGKPYHVDVTWDDPVKDTIGSAYHDNFLVTDQELFNGGHTAYDYCTGAVYSDYSNAVWKNSESTFELINNKLYYIDHRSHQLICYTDNTVLTSVYDMWKADTSSWWVGNFSKLASDGKNLFYSLSKSIYKYDLTSNTTKVIYTPQLYKEGEDASKYSFYNIFGFKFNEGIFYYYTSHDPYDFDNTGISGSFAYSQNTPTTLKFINGTWYYGNETSLNYSETLVEYCGNWYYVNHGILDWSYTGLIEYCGCWYYISNGILDWNYTGIAEYNGSWYYIQNGTINWNYTGLTHFCGCWYYVENGVINWNYTGLVEYYGAYYHIQNGYLDWNYSGLSYYYGDYYYVTNGCLDWNYTGLTEYYGGWYYVSNGYLDWSVTTLTNYYGVWYYVENGAINWNSDTLCYYGDTWYYVKGGVIAWDYIGYVNYYGVNYLITYGYINWYLQ